MKYIYLVFAFIITLGTLKAQDTYRSDQINQWQSGNPQNIRIKIPYQPVGQTIPVVIGKEGGVPFGADGRVDIINSSGVIVATKLYNAGESEIAINFSRDIPDGEMDSYYARIDSWNTGAVNVYARLSKPQAPNCILSENTLTVSTNQVNDGVSYRFQLYEIGGYNFETGANNLVAEQVVQTFGSPTAIFNNLEDNKTYYVIVRAGSNWRYNSKYSSESMIQTASNQPPTSFSLISPVNDEEFTANTINLSWENSIDPEGGIITFTVTVNTDSGITVFNQTTTSNSIVLSLNELGSFFVEIKASDENGNTVSCINPWIHFRYIEQDNIPPSSPQVISPQDDQVFTNGTVLLDWNVASDSDGSIAAYEVIVNDVGNNESARYNGLETNFTTSALPTGEYWFAVFSIDNEGAYSENVTWHRFFVNQNQITSINLNVLHLPQVLPGDWANTMNCGPASLETIFAYHNGVVPNEQGIRDIDDYLLTEYGLPINNYNGSATNVTQLQGVATHYGFISSAGNSRTEQDLKNEINNGNPVIVAVKVNMSSSPTETGHFMVLRGYDSENYYFNDPGRSLASGFGSNVSYTHAEFIASWQTQTNAAVTIHPNISGGGAGGDTKLISLNQGWNQKTFGIIPENADLEQILILNSEILKIIDSEGNQCIRLPDGTILNLIGDVTTTNNSFNIKASQSVEFSLTGEKVNPYTYVFDIGGWYYIANLSENTVDIETFLAELISAGKLVKAINDSGNQLVFVPSTNSFLNLIGFLSSGETIYIKVNSACSLNIN